MSNGRSLKLLNMTVDFNFFFDEFLLILELMSKY